MTAVRGGRWRAGAGLLWLPALLLAACGSSRKIAMRTTPEQVEVFAGDSPFATWRSTARRPVLWPVRGPDGVELTRGYPFREADGDGDHPHHESFWFAHGNVNGVDFWQGDGRIVELHRVVDEPKQRIHGVCAWRAKDGTELCRDHRIVRFAAERDRRTVDFDVTILPAGAPLVFGDTKEGTFALRLRREFRLADPSSTAAVKNSEGITGPAVWGRTARWVAYAAVVEGRSRVVAILDHPDNPRHPTHWHARDYGLFAANPFGLHDFAAGPERAGDLTVPPGSTVRFRYRVLLADGTLDDVDVERAWQHWADQ